MAESTKPSIAQIKRLPKQELLELAEKFEVAVDEGLSVRQLRRILYEALWSVQEVEHTDEEVENVVPNSQVGSVEQLEWRKLQLEERRLELEVQERREAREAQERLEAREAQERREVREHELKLKELELDHNNSSSSHVGHSVAGFRIHECYRSVPHFEEFDVEGFFSQFERIASELDWPKRYWHI